LEVAIPIEHKRYFSKNGLTPTLLNSHKEIRPKIISPQREYYVWLLVFLWEFNSNKKTNLSVYRTINIFFNITLSIASGFTLKGIVI